MRKSGDDTVRSVLEWKSREKIPRKKCSSGGSMDYGVDKWKYMVNDRDNVMMAIEAHR